MIWYSHVFQNFPQFMVIHRVKGISIVNKAEIDVFLELSCFFDDPMDVGNLISGSSAFSKTSALHIKSHDLHVERGGSWWKLLDKKLIFLSLTFYQLMQLINCSLLLLLLHCFRRV